MKKTVMSFVFVLAVLIIPCWLFAEQGTMTETKTETKTETLGTVNEISPDTIVIQTRTSKSPLTYSYTKTTTYVDETGAPVTIETVKSGQPVTVYYTLEDGRMIANKVVVHKTTTTKTIETK